MPDRPTLFEFFMNDPLYSKLSGKPIPSTHNSVEEVISRAEAFAAAGYDYATVYGSDFAFSLPEKDMLNSISLNDGAGITSWDLFYAYPWPDPDDADYSKLAGCKKYLPEGLKLMVMGPGGVLENVIAMTGYDNLCLMIYDTLDLVQALFDAVGERLVRYYEQAAKYDSVGMLLSNDDWGFKQQTMLSTEQMKKYVYPWHRKIVEVIHHSGKPIKSRARSVLASLR